MASTLKLETPAQAPHGQETPCCRAPATHGYPEESPAYHICLRCGAWSQKGL